MIAARLIQLISGKSRQFAVLNAGRYSRLIELTKSIAARYAGIGETTETRETENAMRRKKTNSDVQARHKMKVYRLKAVFRNAPDLPIVFNADTEDGYRDLSHFENEDGTVRYIPRAVKDFDAIDTIKEVDG